MPDAERRVIWGMMVGEEAKTKIPIYQNYTDRGFDLRKHMLQSYGTGWQSAKYASVMFCFRHRKKDSIRPSRIRENAIIAAPV